MELGELLVRRSEQLVVDLGGSWTPPLLLLPSFPRGHRSGGLVAVPGFRPYRHDAACGVSAAGVEGGSGQGEQRGGGGGARGRVEGRGQGGPVAGLGRGHHEAGGGVGRGHGGEGRGGGRQLGRAHVAAALVRPRRRGGRGTVEAECRGLVAEDGRRGHQG